MKYLLDTSVVSELNRANCSPLVKQRIESISDNSLYMSVITIGEIKKAISFLAEGKRKAILSTWLKTLQAHYATRLLMIDLKTTLVWGELTAEAQKNGITIPASDGLIAACACQHDLCILTRNVNDFKQTGARIENPWTV